MNKLKTKKQVEAVIWLHNLTEKDEIFLIQIELHHVLVAAKIKNFPHKYAKNGSNGLIQYYIPTTRWDEEWFETIVMMELGNKYLKVVSSVE